jgi:hypothetical protein
MQPMDVPVVEDLGNGVIRYGGSELWVVVQYQYAAMSMGDEWLMLDVAMTAAEGRSVTVRRDGIFVRTPQGVRVPIASQSEFGKAYGQLRSRLVRANIVSNPQVYFPASRRLCSFQFFAVPGSGVTFDEVSLNDTRACVERLFFRVPGGIQPGRWVLGVDLEESDVRVPFDLGQ